MQEILLRFFPLRGTTLYWLTVSRYNQSTGSHLAAWWWLMGAAQCRAHGGPSAHLGLLPDLPHGSPEIKSGVTRWTGQTSRLSNHLPRQYHGDKQACHLHLGMGCSQRVRAWNNSVPFLSESSVLFHEETMPCFPCSTGLMCHGSFFSPKNIFSWPSGCILSGRAAADSQAGKREELCRHLAV